MALVLLAGCGSGGTVATVDGEPIGVAAHAHWSRALAAARGEQRPSAATRARALDMLVTDAWIEREARARGVEVIDPEPRAGDADVRARERIRLLAGRVRVALGISVEAVTAAAVTRYYRSHRNRFRGPARRGTRAAVTTSATRARRARDALRDGARWHAVVRRFSLDPTPAVEKGRLAGVTERQDRAIVEAVFGAAEGEAIGPVSTPAGHYILQVERVREPRRRPLLEVAREIRELLAARADERAHERLLATLRSRWRERTRCARELVTRNCRSGG